MTLEDYDNEVVNALTDDLEEQDNLLTAFQRARAPFDESTIIPLQESYSYLCFWMAPAFRLRAKSETGTKTDAQFVERYMTNATEAMKTALMSYMSNLKAERGNQ